MRLANEGAVPQKPQDILHTPYVLEFAGLKDKASYHESDLESAVIEKMQKFLLELGKGFLFEQRQKRFTFHDKNFYVDLVLYNRLLRCYVLIDFKLVSGYLDFAERQAEREQVMTMKDWAEHLDRILTMTGEQLLQGNGSVSHKQAVNKATDEYKKYKARTISDVEEDYLNSIKMLEQEADKK